MEHAAVVHRTLQTISLPSKDIVRMGAVSLAIRVAPDEWLRAIFRPHVGEHGRVPHCLVSELRHLDGMRCWAWTGRSEAAFGGGEHVALVVWRVEVLSIPATREMVDRHDASRARTCGKVGRFKAAREDGLEASVRKALLGSVERGRCGAAYSHAESLESHQLPYKETDWMTLSLTGGKAVT